MEEYLEPWAVALRDILGAWSREEAKERLIQVGEGLGLLQPEAAGRPTDPLAAASLYQVQARGAETPQAAWGPS